MMRPLLILALIFVGATLEATAQPAGDGREMTVDLAMTRMTPERQWQEVDGRLWPLLTSKAFVRAGDKPSIRLELGSDCMPLGARADIGSVRVDKALIASLYEVSVANVVVHLHLPPGIDGRKLVDDYQRKLAQTQIVGRTGEPCPRPASIFDVLEGQSQVQRHAQLDPEFWRLANINWRQAMMFLLAHELGHVALDHARSPRSLAEKETEANLFAVRSLDAISPSMGVAGGVVMSYVLYVLFEEWARETRNQPQPMQEQRLQNYRRLCADTVTIIAKLQTDYGFLLRPEPDDKLSRLADALSKNLDPIVSQGRSDCGAINFN